MSRQPWRFKVSARVHAPYSSESCGPGQCSFVREGLKLALDDRASSSGSSCRPGVGATELLRRTDGRDKLTHNAAPARLNVAAMGLVKEGPGTPDQLSWMAFSVRRRGGGEEGRRRPATTTPTAGWFLCTCRRQSLHY